MIDTVLIPQGFHLQGQQLAEYCGGQIQACVVCGRAMADKVFVQELPAGEHLGIGFCRQCSERPDLQRVIRALIQVYYLRAGHLAWSVN